jgi:hypothetical protein
VTATDIDRRWVRDLDDRIASWQKERDFLDYKARLEPKLHAKRRARLAAEAAKRPAAPLTSGRGWRVSENPRRPHADLEAFAKRVWDLGFLALPWIDYRVRWGNLSGLRAAGLCVGSAKLIIIDEDLYNGEFRSGESLIRTLVHEMVHAVHITEGDPHGPRFEDTFNRVMAYMNPAPEPAAPVRPVAPAPPHTPAELVAATKGRRFDGRPVAWAGAGEWEYRG